MGKTIKFCKFKYKGKKYILTELELDPEPGAIMNVHGIIFIAINKELSRRVKMLYIHKAITGSGLRFVNSKRKVS